jgi:hypothetical protein
MNPSAAVPIKVELFEVSLSRERGFAYVLWTRDLRSPCPDPDCAVRQLIDEERSVAGIAEAAPPAILHSTSWRWDESGTIVLTYLALYERLPAYGYDTKEMVALPVAPATNPHKPRPARIREEDVLAHGLRHLAFLIQQDRGAPLRNALPEDARAFLDSLEPAQAGRIGTDDGTGHSQPEWDKVGLA